ncbi:MAG: aspartate aminotransferase family protein [Deltaproteobacteria bacterium]|jgi:acetylornithine/N-succinyldiaminopimelate aminotransferase|nr:aspartate aminotransferase family protein [Deltaproteobacteria bacterium]
MGNQKNTIATEDAHCAPFFNKTPISIERGEGLYVWDEDGNEYMDFTAGWGVTCLGHAHPVITEALAAQSRKIMQNPNSGITYSPARARLLSLLMEILPKGLTRVFFSNSGAEANDASIKLARKATGRLDVVSTDLSFHGRTISTASATGQAKHRDKFKPLMPNYRFVPFNDLRAMEKALDREVAAVILEPIQGEGGVNLPAEGYLESVSALCKKNGCYLIIDEVQTGFCRTGPMFAIDGMNVKPDFFTLAKGIAGGFPFGAFAMTEEVAQKLQKGDHGGTYCGNPLGCAVAYAVISHLMETDIGKNVESVGSFIYENLKTLQQAHPAILRTIRGKGLLLAMEICEPQIAAEILDKSLDLGLFVNLTQGNVIRVFPALNIRKEEAEEGLELLKKAITMVAEEHGKKG